MDTLRAREGETPGEVPAGAPEIRPVTGAERRFGWQSLLGWVGALLLLAWRATCRYRVVDDPRPALRRAGRPYVYALLHAHQVAAVFVNDEERLAAMVSRSAHGDMLVPSLRVRGVTAVRGSTRTRTRDKGGRKALEGLAALVEQRIPGLIAVDGPRGPRSHVHKGIVDLARTTGAAVLPTLVLPRRRIVIAPVWDRFQVPAPFTEVRLIFGPPLELPADLPVDEGRRRIRQALLALERRYDPAEAARVDEAGSVSRAHRLS